ncbi:MAG TPA: NADH-quinone oxidoreductase subunit G, partial [Gammaproteobacteria bacterium]|nr:NADH-quinone oxidoreductase subunit G [Gammaproteobacteria bacterium]
PKPLPACATPAAPGMKVFTHSELARQAQQGTMEFLLINHPLDCPVCDQGGECELQDLAVGYGNGVSRYTEIKRVVPDKDIGPLIATEMTRCIHCTRCVRFGEEISGQREMGATGRGDRMEIGTFIAKSVDSELSGNVIDLCPVGALTAKPSRFQVRPWELSSHDSIAAHDAVGSNISVHTKNGRVIRVVPRDNEAINECWISDRDRFSYQGIYADDRCLEPRIKKDGDWVTATWEEALTLVNAKLRQVEGENVGALLSPGSTLEELYLAQKYLRGMGVTSIDHRLRQCDFSDQDVAPLFPWFGMDIESTETLGSILVVGADVRRQAPMLGHRIRKAALAGAQVAAINSQDYDFRFDLYGQVITDPDGMINSLAAITRLLLKDAGADIPASLADLISKAEAGESEKTIAKSLLSADRSLLLLGADAINHPHASILHGLATLCASLTNLTAGLLSENANAAGAWLAGAVPHRGPAMAVPDATGLDAARMLRERKKAYFLLGLEPEFDMADPEAALTALKEAEFVVLMSPYANAAAHEYADVILPIATWLETAGTFVNGEGRWQGFRAAVEPLGEARPAWKVFRTLGTLENLPGLDQVSVQQVREELQQLFSDDFEFRTQESVADKYPRMEPVIGLNRIGNTAIYASDPVVRRSAALQATHYGSGLDAVSMNPAEAAKYGVAESDTVKASQAETSVELPLVIREGVAANCAVVSAGTRSSSLLGAAFGPIRIEKA